MGSTMNPWKVMSLDEFLFYCCPECDDKTQDYTEFFNHAVLKHKSAQETLLGNSEVKPEPDPYQDDDLEEFELPVDPPSDIKTGTDDFHEESFESIDGDEESFENIEDFTQYEGDESNKCAKVKLEPISDEQAMNSLNVCSYCNKNFGTRTRLINHMIAEHNTSHRQYVCDHCDSKFKTRNSLKLHINSKHEGYSITCEKCGNKFSTLKSLERHQKTVDCSIGNVQFYFIL